MRPARFAAVVIGQLRPFEQHPGPIGPLRFVKADQHSRRGNQITDQQGSHAGSPLPHGPTVVVANGPGPQRSESCATEMLQPPNVPSVAC